MVDIYKANACDYIRFIISAVLLSLSIVVTSYAIVTNKTSFFDTVPGWSALLLFIVDMILLGIVEGLQIALVELKRQHPDSYKNSHPAAYRLGQAAAKGDNVERFLMGRQVSVVVLVFFAAKLTTIHASDGKGRSFLFPVPRWCEVALLETGFVACLTVVILAQLMPQIVAAKYPVHFLQFFIMKPTYYICIMVESTGLTHICWCLAALMEKVTHMQVDIPLNDSVDGHLVASEKLEQLHSSLDDIAVVSDSSAEGEDEEKLIISSDDVLTCQFSRFSCMLDVVKENFSPETLQVLKQYLDSHPEKFSQFPSVIGNKMYPAPQALADRFKKDGYPVPRFLMDISDPEHIPPHIIACELLAQNKNLQQEITILRKKLEHA